MTMQLPATWSATPGPTAGKAAEMIVYEAMRERGFYVRMTAMEDQLNELERSVARAMGTSFAMWPDLMITGYYAGNNRQIQLAANVKGITTLRSNPDTFTSPDSSVRGLIQHAIGTRMHSVFLLVNWWGAIRVCTPTQMLGQGIPPGPDQGYWLLDASQLPTLDVYLSNLPPYGTPTLTR